MRISDSCLLNQQGDLEVVGLFNAGITIVFVYAGMVFSVMDQDFIPVSPAFRVPENEESVKERNLCVNRQLEMNVLLLGPIVGAIIWDCLSLFRFCTMPSLWGCSR